VKRKNFIAATGIGGLLVLLVVGLFVLRGKSPQVFDADLKFTRGRFVERQCILHFREGWRGGLLAD